MPTNMIAVRCPKCGGIAEEFITPYGYKHKCCGLWSWGGAPLVDDKTHKARKAAHAVVDPIWKLRIASRTTVYRVLSEVLRMPPDKCHMKLMDAETANKVVAMAPEIIKRCHE